MEDIPEDDDYQEEIEAHLVGECYIALNKLI